MAAFVGTYGSQCSKLLAGPLQGKFLHQSSTFYKEDSSAVQIAEKLSPGCPSLLSMFLDQSCPWCLSFSLPLSVNSSFCATAGLSELNTDAFFLCPDNQGLQVSPKLCLSVCWTSEHNSVTSTRSCWVGVLVPCHNQAFPPFPQLSL